MYNKTKRKFIKQSKLTNNTQNNSESQPENPIKVNINLKQSVVLKNQ